MASYLEHANVTVHSLEEAVRFLCMALPELRVRGRGVGDHEGFQAPPHPHRHRVYFFDPGGNEYEFVEYLSDDPAKRNDYAT